MLDNQGSPLLIDADAGILPGLRIVAHHLDGRNRCRGDADVGIFHFDPNSGDVLEAVAGGGRRRGLARHGLGILPGHVGGTAQAVGNFILREAGLQAVFKVLVDVVEKFVTAGLVQMGQRVAQVLEVFVSVHLKTAFLRKFRRG